MQTRRLLWASLVSAAILAILVTSVSAQTYPTRVGFGGRTVSTRQFPRRHRAHSCSQADRSHWQAVHRRESARSGLPNRGCRRGESCCRRVHPACGRQFNVRDWSRAPQESPVRCCKGFCALGDGRLRSVRVGGESIPPVHSVQDLIKLAKAKPGELSYGSGGPGHTAHIYAELLKRMTGIQMAHVPYKGSPPALNDIVGGHIQLMFGDAVPSLPLIAEGKVRALAVSSGIRLPSAPDIPTMAEAGVHGFDAAAWIMVVAPVKTPTEIVGKLRSQLIPMLAAPDVQSWITNNGMIPAKSQIPEDLQRFMSSEQARWRGVLEEIGIAGSQ